MHPAPWLAALLFALLLAACTMAAPEGEPPTPAGPAPSPPPAEVELLPPEEPPGGAEREFSTDFSKHTVPYSEILSGGPPKDGIPAIDSPRFESVAEADRWLEPNEPVVMVTYGGVARAYPLRIFMFHEIVNDEVGGLPLAVTYCPLCNTAIAFERQVGERLLDFGTTGRLRFSNLIMYDRQSESWWQQATGEAIIGELVGQQLAFYPAPLVAWQDFKAAYPEGEVLSQETGFSIGYGRNPYRGYDLADNYEVDEGGYRDPFLYVGPDTPTSLPPVGRILGVEIGEEAVAYPYEILEVQRVVNDMVAGEPIAIFWTPGSAAALEASTVAGGRDVGAAVAYQRTLDGRTLTFLYEGEAIRDQETGSRWNILGQAVGGELEGSQLEPVVGVNHFWFSWAAFNASTRLYEAAE